MVQDPNQPSAFGLTANVAAGIASFFMGIGGLVILLGKPPQQWVRFVSVQSIVLAVSWIVIGIVLTIVRVIFAFVPGIGWTLWSLIGIVYLLCALAFFIMWLIQTVRAFQGAEQRFPIISDWTDRFMPAVVNLASPTYTTPGTPTYAPPPPHATVRASAAAHGTVRRPAAAGAPDAAAPADPAGAAQLVLALGAPAEPEGRAFSHSEAVRRPPASVRQPV
jgi:uncharacterized membrane protein